MLSEVSVVEQRYLAVREVLEGARVTDVALRYGVDRRSVHRWLLRYANEGLGALADRSSRPDRCPHQMSAEVEARIVALRSAHPGWGPRTILSKLRREMETPPSRSGIYRCLVRHRMIQPKPRPRRVKDYRRWERSRPMELWQMDVMGGVWLKDGTELKAVTGIDDHSRFCVIASLVVRATARPVCDALLEGLSRHGVPEQILTDNGRVFTGRLGRTPSIVAFDRICLANGIGHLLTAPYSPTTTGKIERLHKTMRKELFEGRRFASLEEAQQELDAWVVHYNQEREHHSILKHRYHVGRHLAGQRVRVSSVDGLLSVTHDGVLVATHARRHLAEDDDRMDRRSKASRPGRPTAGDEVMRKVDPSGSVSFAGTTYRVGNRYVGHTVGVRLVGETVQITQDGLLLRTHRARHDKTKEFGALANPGGRPRKEAHDVA